MVTIKKLASEDWKRFKELSIRAFTEEPIAFGSSPDEAIARDDEYWKDAIGRFVFAEDDKENLMGMKCIKL